VLGLVRIIDERGVAAAVNGGHGSGGARRGGGTRGEAEAGDGAGTTPLGRSVAGGLGFRACAALGHDSVVGDWAVAGVRLSLSQVGVLQGELQEEAPHRRPWHLAKDASAC
jgi:hypothetical protein